MKHREKIYTIPTTSTTNHHAQHISPTSVILLSLYTTKKLPTVDKEYMCFRNDGKTAQVAKCVKSKIMNRVIDYVLYIGTFEQKCVVLKGMLKSPLLKDHVNTIGIDQSLRNNALFEHKCLQNINKLYKHAGNCDDQQQFKDILEAAMAYTPERFTDNSPRSPMTPTPVKKPSAVKSLCLFTKTLDVKKKTYIRQVGAAKSKRKAIKS